MSAGTDPLNPDPTRNRPSYNNTNSSWTDVDGWIIRATEAQNRKYAENAGVFYQQAKTIDTIETYILTTAFGSNGVKQCSLAVSLKFWYNHVYRSIAAKIRKKIQKCTSSTTVEINIVFVMGLLKDKVKNEKTNEMQNAETTAPVFYFKDSQGELKYIDLFAKVYDDWNHYLTSNCIDPALMCYPKNGYYGQRQETNRPTFNSNVLPDLAIEESPACGTLQTAGRWVKKTLAVVSPILTVASVVGIIPKLKDLKYVAKFTPAIQNVNKYYRYVNLASTITFSLVSIGDKVTHGADWEDTLAEITAIAASVLNSLGDDLTKRYLKGKLAGGQTELTFRQAFFFNLFAWSRCATAIAGVLTTLLAMMYKPECSAMDYFLLASSLYSCYGILTSPKSAQKIFNQVKAEYINELLIAARNNAAEKQAKNDQSAEKQEANTNSETNKDQNTDAGNNDDNGDQEEPSNKAPTNEELTKKRDELAKNMMKDENDTAGKAAYEYYQKNFVLAFKDTENEYVMNKQLVRMMKYAPDVREMFCEIALTETTLAIQGGILLVNGQLNIDGAALGQVHNTTNTDVAERLLKKIQGADPAEYKTGNKTDRETLLQKMKDYNDFSQTLTTDEDRQAADKTFLDDMEHFTMTTNGYRFFFEANARNFERQFLKDMGKSLDEYEIGGKNLFRNMSTMDTQRLHQQLYKHGVVTESTPGRQDIKKYNSQLFTAAVKLANARGCESVRDLASYIGIMEHESRSNGVDRSQFLDDIINERNKRLETIQENINKLMKFVEENMDGNQNRRGFHNPLEGYEHAMQHGSGTNIQDWVRRRPGAEAYLNGSLPTVINPRWNQWGTKEGYFKRYYDPP